MTAALAMANIVLNENNTFSAEQIFRLRAEAKAILVEACADDLQDAVDELQAYAVRIGLIKAIGQDAVQAIMAEAFDRLQYEYRLLIGPAELAAWLGAQP